MSANRRTVIVACLALIAVGTIALVLAGRAPDTTNSGSQHASPASSSETLDETPSSVAELKVAADADANKAEKNHLIDGVIPKEGNPTLAHLTETKDGKPIPERMTALATPTIADFDFAAFKEDPAPYLAAVGPNRMYHVAAYQPGIKRIRVHGDSLFQVDSAPGTSCELVVRTEPFGPVSFISHDRGTFDNELPYICVQANKEGLAATTFTVTPGTIADCHIHATSPLNTGRAEFLVIAGQQSIHP